MNMKEKLLLLCVILCAGMAGIVCMFFVQTMLELKSSSLTPEEEKIVHKNFGEIKSVATKKSEEEIGTASFFVVYDSCGTAPYCWIQFVDTRDTEKRFLHCAGVCFQKHGFIYIVDEIDLAKITTVIPYGTSKFEEIAMQVLSPDFVE